MQFLWFPQETVHGNLFPLILPDFLILLQQSRGGNARQLYFSVCLEDEGIHPCSGSQVPVHQVYCYSCTRALVSRASLLMLLMLPNAYIPPSGIAFGFLSGREIGFCGVFRPGVDCSHHYKGTCEDRVAEFGRRVQIMSRASLSLLLVSSIRGCHHPTSLSLGLQQHHQSGTVSCEIERKKTESIFESNKILSLSQRRLSSLWLCVTSCAFPVRRLHSEASLFPGKSSKLNQLTARRWTWFFSHSLILHPETPVPNNSICYIFGLQNDVRCSPRLERNIYIKDKRFLPRKEYEIEVAGAVLKVEKK